jgi:hypothetical protein
MKRATKESIVLLLLWKGFGLGLAFIIYGIGSYFYDIEGFLTPYLIWNVGGGLILGAVIGMLILKQKKKKHRK